MSNHIPELRERHEAERMRAQLDQVRELAEIRLSDRIEEGRVIHASEILGILGEPHTPPASSGRS